jgi:pimeloyl-ACP methyl ester carboxylesterase
MDFNFVVLPALIALTGLLVAWLSTWRIRSLANKNSSSWRRIAERIPLSLLALAGVVIAGSSIFNAIVLHRFRTSPPGEIHAVNGHRMRISCTGSGSPAIILDAGLGNDGLIWGGLQPVLAKTTRVCSYDRAGFGWSDPLPQPRDANHIAIELHALLAAANIRGPVVLMGHSISGMYIRDYATRYPAEVAGLIFVDGSTPLQNRNPAFQMGGPPPWFFNIAMRVAYSAGIPRLHGTCSLPFPGFDAQAEKLQREDICYGSFGAIAGELESFDQSGEETVGTGPYGALPILIFSQDPSPSGGKVTGQAEAWNTMQENLKKLSVRSRRIIAKGSPHYVQLIRRDLIEREVPLFIEQIRGAARQPSNYGSTTTE